MSTMRSYQTTQYATDHFEPEADSDPQAQRRLRGHLEQIDFTAFACNQEVVSRALGTATLEGFRRLALAAATARAQWAKEALAITEQGAPTTAQVERLAELRCAYRELTEAYEGLRRMVERGHLPYQSS